MELEEFITKTLVSINRGVKAANKEIDPNQPYYLIESATAHKDRSDGYIKFDVAVTATDTSGTKASAGIRVWSVGAGADAENSASNQSVTRIKFGIAPNYTTG